MRILFNSKDLQFKNPFGTLIPGQECTLCIHIPASVQTTKVECILESVDGDSLTVTLSLALTKGAYEQWSGTFALPKTGLYYYYFRIYKRDGAFRLFKQGDDTNMEAGDRWQLSCVPSDFTVPQWAKGATIYQIFPDRFHKSGECDLTGKLQPYTIHENWEEEVDWRPTPKGEVLNNDFYGGNFNGITEKLPYLASLGVTLLYLNPISKSFSSHRYDTADYKTPDPMLGTKDDFAALCEAAHARDIRVVLDGVFSHTGADSLYFDKYGNFGKKGAYCDKNSPYSSWYLFEEYPDRYKSWWGFDTLPTVNKNDPAFMDYIIDSEDSVIAHWLKLGADGFRLDVADELPDSFVLRLKNRLRQLKPDGLLIGEVWEDASNKIAYDIRRRYFVDGELDSCMNYPFRTAILEFMRGMDDGRVFWERVMTILENYPPQVVHCNMNLLGSHDTPRILTALVDSFDGPRELLAQRFLSGRQQKLAQMRLMVASFLQFTLPGAPSIYYGDEAGMEGGKDPFNRRTYPWGRENGILLNHFRCLGQLRKQYAALRLGDIQFFQAGDGKLGFSRTYQGKTVKVFLNRSLDAWEVPAEKLIMGHNLRTVAPTWLSVAPQGFCIVEE